MARPMSPAMSRTALTHPERLAGVIALSTYMPVAALLRTEASEENRQTPIFAAHGTEDDVVSPELGILARDLLVQEGYPVVWHEFPMPHSVCWEEIVLIGGWLRKRMKAVSSV